MSKTRKKNKKKTSAIIGFIVLTILGIMSILIGLRDVGLSVLGDTAKVTSFSEERVGGYLDGLPSDRQYKWNVNYAFEVNGKEYSGNYSARGSDYSAHTPKTVHYFPLNPNINSMTASSSVEMFGFLGVGVFLLWVGSLEVKKLRKNRNK